MNDNKGEYNVNIRNIWLTWLRNYGLRNKPKSDVNDISQGFFGTLQPGEITSYKTHLQAQQEP